MEQTRSNKRLMVLIVALALLLISAGVWWGLTRSELAAGIKVAVTPAGADSVRLVSDDGDLIYRVTWNDGSTQEITPVLYAKLLEEDYQGRPAYMRILNITTTAGLMWVFVGVFAQVLFMGRMIVQWVASERLKRSVVPPAFWWMSLGGASMLIVYFLWRKDIVGVFGQATGWVVYIRNLMLIQRAKPTEAVEAMDEEPVIAGEEQEQKPAEAQAVS